MRFSLPSIALLLAVSGCNSSPSAVQPQDEKVENSTLNAAVAPEGATEPGVPANIANEVTQPTTIGRPSPADVVTQYARLLHARDFSHAYNLWDPNSRPTTEAAFEKQFDHLKTIDAAVGKIGQEEGAAGSLYDEIQLTLSGVKDDGSNYVLTGPVTLRRVNDVPGSTEEQRQWHIVKTELSGDPKAAEQALNQ